MGKTTIEWTTDTWNPVRTRLDEKVGWGCQRVSPGCQHCYAATMNHRLGTGLDYDAKGVASAEFFLDEKVLLKPLSWRKPRKVFVCSMTDLFGEWVPDEWIDRMFAVMALTPQHTYQVLTKRSARMRDYMGPPSNDGNDNRLLWLRSEAVQAAAQTVDLWPESWEDGLLSDGEWPPRNVWLGVSVEDQQRADERIPELLATPAAVRFLSCEPLLGPLNLTRWLHDSDCFEANTVDGSLGCVCSEPREDHISWVIIGGESEPGARPMDVAWARSLVAQCREAGVAAFVKQLGAQPLFPCSCGRTGSEAAAHAFCEEPARRLKNRKGGEISEWPEDLRVREWPV